MLRDRWLALYQKLPFAVLMRNFGLDPDPWQAEVLEGRHSRLLLNCSRQAGKSTVVAALSLLESIWASNILVLLLSRSHRQSRELFRQVLEFHRRLEKVSEERQTANELQLTNHSRIVCLPCSEATIRGYANVNLLVIDEAARVPDDLYRAVRPMLAVSKGRLICLSTPYGKRGFFYDAWTRGGSDWARIEVPAERITRIKADFLEQERRALGESWYRQEYGCSFEALEGLVYPDFARCVVPSLPAHLGAEGAKLAKKVGGIDFGFRNPFAAVWGILDRDGILWLTGEHYCRERPLSFHAHQLPRDVTWYADPSGAGDIMELRCAQFNVQAATNDRRPGIAAVRGRLENGLLKVLAGRCPNLLAEAELYRYPDAAGRKSETPMDEHDHALDALRYLICKLDRRHLARGPKPAASAPASGGSELPAPPARRIPLWRDPRTEHWWTRQV